MGKFNNDIVLNISAVGKKHRFTRYVSRQPEQDTKRFIFLDRNTKKKLPSGSNPTSPDSVTVTLSVTQSRKQTGQIYDNARGENRVCLLSWYDVSCLPYPDLSTGRFDALV